MNKSSYEYQTGHTLKKINRGYWQVFDGETKIAEGSGHRDAEIVRILFSVFWKARKKEVIERDGYKCVECSSPFNLQVDHVVNRSQRGTSKMENLQTLCESCHRSKTRLEGKWAVKRV